MTHSAQNHWKVQCEQVFDAMVAKLNTYSSVESNLLLSMIEGGATSGLSQGSYAQTADGSKLTIIGFVDSWHGLNIGEKKDKKRRRDDFDSDEE
jgi:hypothetical protein